MEFIQKYARVDDLDEDDIAEEDEVRRQSDNDFIDDNEIQDQDPSDYRIKNITRDLQEVLQDKEMWIENYVPNCYDEVEYDYDDFNGFKKRKEKLKKASRFSRKVIFLFCSFIRGIF